MAEKKFRAPRIWSNSELDKFAHLFFGKVANISGWMDNDKEGWKYKEYFYAAIEYWLTNYKTDTRGFQGNLSNEIFLDLSVPLDIDLQGKFDVVFSHTVLEHIFELDVAFENLCKLSKDIIIIVVPFLQEQHAAFGDYWRFTPQAVDKLFQKNGCETLYINFNDSSDTSIYVFAVASKQPEQWGIIRRHPDNRVRDIYNVYIGTRIIRARGLSGFQQKIVNGVKRILR